jgi:hypothetical protein
MIKPPVSEARRRVTLESPGLKPIHKQEYKYGYNPYFLKNDANPKMKMDKATSSLTPRI